MDIIELLQREIQDLKMKAGKLIEENVVLKGFKAMVMQDPKKYNHNNPPETIFDEERRKFKESQTLRQEELDRIKLDNNNLYTRVADALEVNERHQELNGKLQERVTELEQDNLELHADNKKLALQIEDKVDQLRKSGM